MTPEELQQLIQRYPFLYHMAESGSWPSIRARGLLSTSALLDLFEIEGEQRRGIERARRPESVTINHDRFGLAVIRDQKPMADEGLLRSLQDGLQPEDWYALLNSRVFFWLTEERLKRLLNARPYAPHAHDVLVVRTASIVEAHRGKIVLAPMNTGCTKPVPHPRGLSTFKTIDEYPYSSRRKYGRDAVVELAVLEGVPDIADHVVSVREMRGDEVLRTIWP